MSGYTKLFSSIVGSTIWGESNETKILWITMLAIADKYGEVSASLPGLAQLARLELKDVKAGLERLSSPDEYSRTKDYEGRRIKEIDGGWLILNHGKYREKMNEDERREKNAEYQKRFRDRKKNVSKSNGASSVVSSSNVVSALSAHAEAESASKADSKEEREKSQSSLPLTDFQVRLSDGIFDLPQKYQIISLVKALRAWARHMMSRKPFGKIEFESLLVVHSSAGWSCERLERGILLSLSKNCESTIIDPDEHDRKNGKTVAAEIGAPPPRKKRTA